VSDEDAAKLPPTIAPKPSTIFRLRSFSKQDAWTAALLSLGLAALYAVTRSRWLDDWDSVQFALGLDDFDVTRHQPHPPGYPVYIAAGKIIHFILADHASALTLLSSLSGAAVATMFYILSRRYLRWSLAFYATIFMALMPLFWLQAGLALTDMFGMIFVLTFMLVEGASTRTRQGALLRRIGCGVITGLSLGARPHFTLLIIAYGTIRAFLSGPITLAHFLAVAISFLVGVVAWLLPTSLATGGLQTYLSACLSQFEWRFHKPEVSVLGGQVSSLYLINRAALLIGWLGQTFAPIHISLRYPLRAAALGLAFLTPCIFFAWRSAASAIARPYIIASAVYLLMIFVTLPPQTQRYFLPFSLIVGWSLAGLLALFRRPIVRSATVIALFAVDIMPSFFLVRGLSEVPPPVAAINWIKSNRPAAIFYAGPLSRHATFYWPEGDARPVPKDQAECDTFRREVDLKRTLISTIPKICGLAGEKIVSFKRDRRIHSKHYLVSIFEFGDPE